MEIDTSDIGIDQSRNRSCQSSSLNTTYLRNHLVKAIKDQKDRILLISAKWLGEHLLGMSQLSTDVDVDDNCNDIDMDNETMHVNTTKHDKKEDDAILFASILLANNDYLRCAHFLRKRFTTGNKYNSKKGGTCFSMSSKLGMFMGAYSLYMAGEKCKEQESEEMTNRSNEDKNGGKKNNNSNKGKNGGKDQTNSSSISYIFAKKYTDSTNNPYLHDIYRELIDLYYCHVDGKANPMSTDDGDGSDGKSLASMDGYLMYIFAIVVRDIRKQGAGPAGMPTELLAYSNSNCNSNSTTMIIPSCKDLLIESIRLDPWNWSVWLELAEDCLANNDHSCPSWSSIFSPTHSSSEAAAATIQNANDYSIIMYYCFCIHLHLEQQQGEEALHILTTSGIATLFPYSQILLNQSALAYYCLRDYNKAQETFEIARDVEPHRLDHVDTYSNILYVKEKKAELSHLAHAVTKSDKYSPETCCVVGNYYSLKGQHEKAIMYFQRALRLNSRCISAWTLMGHEFVELRNTAAAVQCYRKAVDVSSRDYRAWYGLGQTYEMLHMYQYAVYYYKKAASLKPIDARMWCAVGNCFSRLGLKHDSMLALERAVNCGDREGIAIRELARLYRDSGQAAKAAECYHRHLTALGSMESTDGVGSMKHDVIDGERAEGLIYLATYHRKRGDLKNAEEYCIRLADYIGPEGDEARAMQREIRSHFQKQSSSSSSFPPTPSPVRILDNSNISRSRTIDNNIVGDMHSFNNSSYMSEDGGVLVDSDEDC